MSFPPGTEMFQFPGFASRPYAFRPGYPKGVGFPIRTSADQRSLASPRGFSQRATSFIAFWRQGIHRTPLLCSTLRIPVAGNPRPTPARRTYPPRATNRTDRNTQTHRDTHIRNTPCPAQAAHKNVPALNTRSRFTMTNIAGQTPHAPSREPHGRVFPEALCPTQPGRRSRLDQAGPGNLLLCRFGQIPGDGRIRTDDPLLAKQVLSH